MYSAGTFYPQLEPTIITGMDTAGTQLAPSSNYWLYINYSLWDGLSWNPAGTLIFLAGTLVIESGMYPAGTQLEPLISL